MKKLFEIWYLREENRIFLFLLFATMFGIGMFLPYTWWGIFFIGIGIALCLPILFINHNRDVTYLNKFGDRIHYDGRKK